MSKTVVIQLGNSDNKLTQVEWSEFVAYVRDAIGANSINIHFDGGSKHDAPWQNACFVCEVCDEHMDELKADLKRHREAYRQDSVAFTIGDTLFV